MLYIANAFAGQMIPDSCIISKKPVPTDIVKQMLENREWESCVGHTDTASVLSGILGVTIPANRVSISLTGDDVLIVAQVMGGRLPEGTTTLPEGTEMKFFMYNLMAWS